MSTFKDRYGDWIVLEMAQDDTVATKFLADTLYSDALNFALEALKPEEERKEEMRQNLINSGVEWNQSLMVLLIEPPRQYVRKSPLPVTFHDKIFIEEDHKKYPSRTALEDYNRVVPELLKEGFRIFYNRYRATYFYVVQPSNPPRILRISTGELSYQISSVYKPGHCSTGYYELDNYAPALRTADIKSRLEKLTRPLAYLRRAERPKPYETITAFLKAEPATKLVEIVLGEPNEKGANGNTQEDKQEILPELGNG